MITDPDPCSPYVLHGVHNFKDRDGGPHVHDKHSPLTKDAVRGRLVYGGGAVTKGT